MFLANLNVDYLINLLVSNRNVRVIGLVLTYSLISSMSLEMEG